MSVVCFEKHWSSVRIIIQHRSHNSTLGKFGITYKGASEGRDVISDGDEEGGGIAVIIQLASDGMVSCISLSLCFIHPLEGCAGSL